MPELSEKELLLKIGKTIEEIKAILTLVNDDKLSEVKKRLLKDGSMKHQVYDLCDGSKSTQEIAKAMQKSDEYVGSYISILRREGFIRTTDKEGKQVPEQIF